MVRSQGGFGEGPDDATSTRGKARSKKVSKRGKVSSRQDPKLQLKQNASEFEKKYGAVDNKYNSKYDDDKYDSNVVDLDLDGGASTSDTVPEAVTNRMLKRIFIFAGTPVLCGMLLFPLFYYIKKVQGIDLPVWAVYIVQTTVFGGGLLGISYGIISTSFDATREGSFLGWNEFKANLPQVLSSFGRK